MDIKSRFFSFYPLLIILLILLSVIKLIKSPGLYSLALLFFVIYLFPLISYRIHNYFFPLKLGRSDLAKKQYSPWWGGHQIQLIYYIFPFFESVLKCIPGAYSFWLRRWGSSIGKNVYWTPNIEIDDRGLIEIGDNVILGHKVEMISHVITPRNDKMILYVKKITIQNECFIGAGSRIGPGVLIEKGSFVPVLTDLYVNQKVKNEN